MGIPEGEESEPGTENLFEEIMTENFHSLVNGNESQTNGPKEAYTETQHN